MKLAFSTNAFIHSSLSAALADIAAAGYAGVEILADHPHWYPARFDEAVAEATRQELEHLHLAVSNVNANTARGYFSDAPDELFYEPSLISPNVKHRADRIELIQNTLQFAKAVGADCISITTGRLLPTVPPDVGAKLLREGLSQVLEVAEKLKIRVGIESGPGLLIEYAAELRELIDRLGSKLLGANFDVNHAVVVGEDVAQSVKLLDNRIWNCHIADLPGRKHYHLIPGTGTMDWQKLRAALEATNYDRFLTVDLYTYPDRPREAANESMAYLRPMFSRE